MSLFEPNFPPLPDPPMFKSEPVPKRPHKCPVCEGRGWVPNGFYGVVDCTSTANETCRSCNGAGIIWTP